MGQSNSSITRAWPIFGALLDLDSTGRAWLNPLLEMCQRPLVSGKRQRSTGVIDPALLRFERPVPSAIKAVLRLKSPQEAKLRNCFEKPLPPPADFLEWLINNPSKMAWPTQLDKENRTARKKMSFGESTQAARSELFAKDNPMSEQAAKALKELRRHGSEQSARKWWAFEGFTSVDVYLETESLILLIECKRNELLSSSTVWYRSRNQLGRNLEVAREQAAKKNKTYGVIVCSEDKVSIDPQRLADSFPHFAEKEDLYEHYWGNVLWRDIHKDLCNHITLPDTVDDAIRSGVINGAIKGIGRSV